MSFANAGEIAASFTKFYYELLTKADSAEELSRLYGDNSCVNFIATPNATTPVTYQGKAQITSFLTKMQETLGERKVNVRHVDYVAADTSVAVTCSGYLYTRMVSRVFSQTFVLAPTKYRTGCYYIVGDSLRFLSEEPETIPNGFVSAEEYESLVAARNASQQESESPAAPVAATPATSAPRKTREDREPREPREPRETREPREPRETREPRERKQKTETAAAQPAAATESPATPAAAGEERAARKPFTSAVRILKVPVDVQLSVVADACAKFGTVTDRYWHKDVDCIITMSKPAEARQIVRLSGRFRIKSFGPFDVEYFYPETA